MDFLAWIHVWVDNYRIHVLKNPVDLLSTTNRTTKYPEASPNSPVETEIESWASKSNLIVLVFQIVIQKIVLNVLSPHRIASPIGKGLFAPKIDDVMMNLCFEPAHQLWPTIFRSLLST
jgi:hypothetical protein